MGKQCSCPFNTGVYKLDKYPIKVDTSKIPGPIKGFGDGEFKVEATFTDGDGDSIFCVDIKASVKISDHKEVFVDFNG